MKPAKRSQRGFTLFEILVATVLAVAALGVATVAVTTTASAFSKAAGYRAQAGEIETLLDELSVSAQTSVALYTPSSCGGGTHGDNQPCTTSVRFFGKDASGATHFWGWEYDAAQHTLTQCVQYPSVDGACSTTGSRLQNILEFSATPRDARTVASVYGLTASNEEYEMLDAGSDSNQRVVAGNRVMVVDVANAAIVREKHLLQGGTPFSTVVLAGAVTAPSAGPMTQIAPTPFIFTTYQYPAYQDGRVQVPGYSAYQPYITGPYWTLSQCTASSGQQLASTSFLYGVYEKGDYLDYRVTPLNNAVGTCDITVGASDGQTPLTVPVTIYAVPDYHLTVSAPAPNPANVGQAAAMNAAAYLSNSNAVRPNFWPSSLPVGITAVTGPCTYTPPGWQRSGTTFYATGSGTGTCTLTFNGNAQPYSYVDDPNQSVSFSIVQPYNNPYYTLNPGSPASNPITLGASTTFQPTDAQTMNNTPPGTPASVAVSAVSSANCSVSPSGWQNSGTAFTITGLSAGTCTITVTDDYAAVANASSNSPQSFTVTVSNPTGCTRAGNTVTFHGGTCTLNGTISLNASCGERDYPDGNWDWECSGDENDTILGDLGYMYYDISCDPYPGWGTEGYPETCTATSGPSLLGNQLIVKFANNNMPTTYANRITVSVAYANYSCVVTPDYGYGPPSTDATCGAAPEILDYDNYEYEQQCGLCGTAALASEIRPIAQYGYSTALSAADISTGQLYFNYILVNDFQDEGNPSGGTPGTVNQSANYVLTITQGSGPGGLTSSGADNWFTNVSKKCAQYTAFGFTVTDGWPVCIGM